MSKSELFRLAIQRGKSLPDDGRREELITEKVVRLTKEIEQLNDKIKTMRKGMDHTLEQTQKNYHELEQQFYNSVTENKQLNAKVAMMLEAIKEIWYSNSTPIAETKYQEVINATEADVTKWVNGVRAECARDAARYRYLRSQVNNDEGTPMAQVVWKLHWIRESSNWTNLVDGNNLDEHCDRALRGE